MGGVIGRHIISQTPLNDSVFLIFVCFFFCQETKFLCLTRKQSAGRVRILVFGKCEAIIGRKDVSVCVSGEKKNLHFSFVLFLFFSRLSFAKFDRRKILVMIKKKKCARHFCRKPNFLPFVLNRSDSLASSQLVPFKKVLQRLCHQRSQQNREDAAKRDSSSPRRPCWRI